MKHRDSNFWASVLMEGISRVPSIILGGIIAGIVFFAFSSWFARC